MNKKENTIFNIKDITNNILCGDCYEMIKKIPDKSIDLIYIDVPYLYFQGGQGKNELAKRAMKKKKELTSLNLQNGFDFKIFEDLFRIMKKTNIFIWCSKHQLNDIMNIFKEKECYFELLTWNKTNPQPTINNSWLPDIEYCLYFREKGVKLNKGYSLKKKWFVSSINKCDKELYKHPTIKPLELVKRHIEHTTNQGDIVLDCFCGSGTTCVAAKELDREFIGIEINQEYCEISKKRINGMDASGQISIFTDISRIENKLN